VHTKFKKILDNFNGENQALGVGGGGCIPIQNSF
jgi:hypothetical protein